MHGIYMYIYIYFFFKYKIRNPCEISLGKQVNIDFSREAFFGSFVSTRRKTQRIEVMKLPDFLGIEDASIKQEGLDLLVFGYTFL